jgi:hypothetical protein
VAFTDGLVERRGELLDIGLGRLAQAALVSAPDLDEFVASIVSGLTGPESTDDIALLAFRWTGAGSNDDSGETAMAVGAPDAVN